MLTFLTHPVPNEAAADFIRNKPIVSRQAFDRMLPEVQALSFTISGVERYDVLQRVRELTAELPQGGDWKKLKRGIAAELSPFLGDEKAAAARAELLLRHHGLQSYRVSQWEQVQRNADVYPYLKYIATRDGDTRGEHSALHGMVLPIDDPFWPTHMPPWEWGCRCQAIQVSQAQHDAQVEREKKLPLDERKVLDQSARDRLNNEGRLITARRDPKTGRLGIPENFDVRAPRDKGNRGPGTVEDLRIPIAALRDRYDPDIWQEFESWARNTELPLLERSVWSWLEGDTATAASAAVVSATTASSPAALVGEIATLSGSDAREAAHRLLEVPAAQRGTFGHKARTRTAPLDAGFDFVNRMTSGTVASGGVQIKRTAARAHATVDGKAINGMKMNSKTVVHELGHIIELRNPAILQAEVNFRAARTAGESAKHLGRGFGAREIALEDEWVQRGGHLYSGKIYKSRHTGKDYATEILSMGLERLYWDPIGFAKQDPEYLQFVLEMIRP